MTQPGVRNVRPSPQAGLTLIELVVSLAVAAILMAVAVPSLRHFVVKTGVTSTANSLVAAISLARSEALSRGMPVAVVPLERAGPRAGP